MCVCWKYGMIFWYIGIYIYIYIYIGYIDNTFGGATVCMCLLFTQLLTKKLKKIFFFHLALDHIKGFNSVFSKKCILHSYQRSVASHHLFWPLTSVAALCGVMAALFPRTHAQRWTIFSHLAGGEWTCTPLHQTHTRKFRNDDKAALFGGIKGSRFCLVRVTYPMLVDAHSEATVYSEPVFANNKYIIHISL